MVNDYQIVETMRMVRIPMRRKMMLKRTIKPNKFQKMKRASHISPNNKTMMLIRMSRIK